MGCIWSFFYRAETRSECLHGLTYGEYWSQKGAYYINVELPLDTDLGTALAAAIEAGCPKGSARSGIFEVQNPLGIWSHKHERRIEVGNKNVSFKTWEDLDDENEDN